MSHREKIGSELFLSGINDPATIAEELRTHFPHLAVQSRCRFRLASSLVPRLHAQEKETTIRYSRNAVEYPISCDLPAYEDRRGDEKELRPIGRLKIINLCYKEFGALTEEDAARDGFGTAAELKTALNDFYGVIDDTEVVSIYAIHLETGAEPQSSL